MELRQLQTFIQIAQMQSFSRTAEMLGYSQSAVTVQIRQLENELGKRLFDRTGKKVVLTPQGEEFLEHANRILYDVHQAKASMNDTDELKNPLHIGTIESLCTVKFPKIIRKFREQYSRVSIRITVDSPEKLIQMMEHNELDLIYILDTPRWDSNWIKVMEKAEPVMFVTSVSHRLAKERNLLLDDLLKESFYLTERNANYRQALDGQLALRRKELSPMLEISDTAFIKKMLMRGGGVSFLPRFAVEDDIEKKKLTLLDVKDIEITMYRQIFYHKNKFKTKEMEKFAEFALEDN